MRPSLRQVLFRSVGLDLNFAGGVFSLNNTRTDTPAAIPGWSFSRTDTNGVATALDLAGNVIQFPSRTNLLLQSQTFGTTWTQTNVTIGSDVIAAPDGSTTADSLIENAAAAVAHRVTQAVTTTAAATTVSCHLKAGSRSWAYIRITNSVPASCFAYINLATGALGTVSGTGATASVQTLADGWYRLSLTVATAVAGSNTIVIAGSTGDNAQDYDGTNGLTAIYLWGAQLELGSTATAYIPTTTAAVTVVLPRITNRGILVEEARTNLLLNSATLSTQTVTTTAVAHTLSFYGTGTVTLSGASTAGPLVGTGANNRVTLTFTPLAAPLLLTVTGSVTTAQLEAGAFATSPIITTGAAGTRGADLPSEPFDLPAAYTIVSEAEVTVAQTGLFPTVVSTSGTNNGLFLNGSNTPGFNLANASYIASVVPSLTTGTIVRHAARAETNNVRGAVNGTLSTLQTSFTPITGSRIVYVGSNVEASGRLNGYIRRLQVLPYAVTDAQLQALTAP